jgi:uncharacterized membrane protein
MKMPCTETAAILGLICIAVISLFSVDQPESIVVGIASGILGWLKGSTDKVQQ